MKFIKILSSVYYSKCFIIINILLGNAFLTLHLNILIQEEFMEVGIAEGVYNIHG